MLRVRLTPKGGDDRIDAAVRDAEGCALIKARVRAAPEHGEANSALEALIARELGLARGKVAVTRGAKARTKVLSIDADESALDALVARYEVQA